MKIRATPKRIKFGGMAAFKLRNARLCVVALIANGLRLALWGRPGDDHLRRRAPG